MSVEILNSKEREFISEKVFPNGFRLIIHQMPHVDTVAGRVSVKAGSMYEFPHLAGSSHFVEHWIPGGTKHLSTYRDVEAFVESKGGDLEEETDYLWVSHMAKLPAEHREHLVPFLFEHVDKPRFRTRDFKREKKIITEEILEEIDNPEKYAHNLLIQHLWKNHPAGMGFGPLGTIESVKSFKKEDLISEFKRLWRPNNMFLVLAGNIDEAQTIKQVEKTFGRLKKTEGKLEIVPPPAYTRENGRVYIRTKRLNQVQILLAFTLDPSLIEKNILAIELLNKILDRNINHSLIHTYGRGYGSEVDIDDIYVGFGNIIVTTSVSSRRAEKAVDEIIRQVNILKLNEANILVEKEYLKGKKTLNLEGPEKMTEFISETAVQGINPISPRELKQKIDRITIEELEEVQKNIFTNDNAVLVLLGSIPTKMASHYEQKLQFGR